MGALDNLIQDAIYRFKRIIIPELVSPADSFWGGEKNLRTEQGATGIITVPKPIEMARVRLDIPSFYTIECVNTEVDEILIRFTIGIGRSIVTREIRTDDPTTYNTDPLIDVATVFVSGNPNLQRRIRIVVWGTSLRVEILPTFINGGGALSSNLIRLSVTPGAGAVTSSTASGGASPLTNSTYVEPKDVAQSAVAVTLLTNDELRGEGGNAGKSHGMTIYNDAAVDLHILFSTVNVTLTSSFVRIPPFTLWEEPFPFYVPTSQDIFLSGIWTAAGGGEARIARYSRFQ